MRRRLAAAEDGVTLVELLVVCAVLAVAMAGIANLLVSGSRAQYDTSGRVDAQQGARLAVDRIEYEARCASYGTTVNSGAGVTLTLASQCSHTSGTSVTWCVSSGVLTRYVGSSCSGTSVSYVSSVTSATPFSIFWTAGQLPRLQMILTVNDTGPSANGYTVTDTVALRNAAAVINTPSPSSGAVGSSVTLTGSGFKPSTNLSVTFGSVAATISSGGTTSAAGAVNAVITVPFSGNGTYTVMVSDGTLSGSTIYTVTGSFDGLMWTSSTHTGGGTLTCGTIGASTTCTIGGLGGTGNFAGKVTLETSADVAVTNTGSTLTVNSSVATVTSPGGSVSPASSTIAGSASTTAGSFTLTGLGSGWKATMTCTVTVNGNVYSLALTGN